MKVLVKAPALSMSGYGEQARFLLRAIRNRKDIDLYLVNIPWGQSNNISVFDDESNWLKQLIAKTAMIKNQKEDAQFDASIQITIPNEWENLAPINIGYTAGIECDRVAPVWIQKANQMDKVITISKHSQDVFENTRYEVINQNKEVVDIMSLNVPIEYVNYSVRSTDRGQPLNLQLSTQFNFLTISQFGPRKNLHSLVNAFVKRFHEDSDVGLIVKTHMKNPSVLDKERTRQKLNLMLQGFPERKCKVYLLHGELSEKQMCSLYQHPDIRAFVTTTHGEGYGLPIFEAACNGLPIVAPNWSGHVDFLNIPVRNKKKTKVKPLFCVIPHTLREVQKEAEWPGVIEPKSQWAFMEESDIMSALGKCKSKISFFQKQAKKLKNHITGAFSEEKIYRQMNGAITTALQNQTSANDVELVRSTALLIKSPKDRALFLKARIQELESQKDKLDLLKDTFKGEKCYILSCGPSLLENNKEKLESVLEDTLTIAIKQAYDVFSSKVDFHVYNCANYKNYDYSNKNPIVIEAATSPAPLGPCDIKFFIQERDFNNSVSATGKIEEWTYDSSPLLRPYGPGIMYEAVFYLLEHLGVSEVVTVGWDNKLLKSTTDKQHFYDKEDSDFEKEDFIHHNEVAANVPMESLEHEAKITSDCIGTWYEWLREKGCELTICSSTNPAPAHIKRVEI